MDYKIKDSIYYLLDKLNTLAPQFRGKKKLAKLLYLIDFYHYRESGKTISSDSYKALPMGPIPASFYKVLGELEADGYLESEKIILTNKKGDEYTLDNFELKKDYPVDLDKAETEFIDEIFEKFKNRNGKYLEDLSHNQAPWNSVTENELIPLRTAHLLPDLEKIS